MFGFELDSSGADKYFTASTSVSPNTWSHIVCTYDNSDLMVYVNGSIADSDSIGPYTPATGDHPVGIAVAARASGSIMSPRFEGKIDEVRIFDTALSSGTINSTLYNGGYSYANAIGNEVGYWKFNDGSGTTLTDQTSNGNNGTINGATWMNSGVSTSVTYTYSPSINYNGSDSFTFTASDGTLLDTATVSITVTAVNDAPVASSDTVTTNEDTDYSGTVSASDVDNNTLTFSVLTSPSNGTVSLTGSSSRIITQDPAVINNYLFEQAAQNRIKARGWPSSDISEEEENQGYQGNFIDDSEFTVLPQYSTFGSRTNTEETHGSWNYGNYTAAGRTRGNGFLISAVDLSLIHI